MSSWPTTLPCAINNLSVKPLSNSIVINPEVGSPLTRVRFTGDMEDIRGTLSFRSRTQALALHTFWKTTLVRGSLPFDWKHPISGAAVSMIFMAEPEFSRNGNAYVASLSLRTMPS